MTRYVVEGEMLPAHLASESWKQRKSVKAIYLADEVDAHLAALPPAMTWTTERPSKPGWYWWYGGEDTERCVFYVSQEDIDKGKWYGGMEWAGPMEPPQ